MNKITHADIAKISKLSKIYISEDDKVSLANQLDKIIDWIDLLKEVNTDDVDILNNIHNQELKLFNDEVNDNEMIQDITKYSKYSKYNYFTTPKIIS